MVTSVTDGNTYQTSYQYLQSGELSLRQTEGGATAYAYDQAGRLTTITDPTQRAYSLTWDADFRLSSLALPADEGHIDYTYYENGATSTQTTYATMDTSSPQASFAYAYNEQGKRENMQVTGLPSGGGDYAYAYDSLGRLTYFDAPGTTNDITYAYDKVGNLTAKGSSAYTYDAANRLATGPGGITYEYDDFGNLEYIKDAGGVPLEAYAYDPLSRLVSYTEGTGPSPTVSFSYDPLKRLTERNQSEGNLSFTYDGTSLNQVEVDDGTQVTSFTLTPDGTHLSQESAGIINYLGLDPHQDITLCLDAQGNLSGSRVYDPYGGKLSGDDFCDLGYQSDYTDPSCDITWMGARWYSPELGRFLSEDPLPGEIQKPLTENLYLYCAGDPVNYNDLTGKSHDPDSEEEPTIQWDVRTGMNKGKSPGEYWNSMADPIQESRAAARERNNKRRALQKALDRIIAAREDRAKAGIGQPPPVESLSWWRYLQMAVFGYPNVSEYYSLIIDEAEKRGVDPKLLMSIIAWESSSWQRQSPKSLLNGLSTNSSWLGWLISPIGEGISRLVSGEGLIKNLSNIIPDISFENLQAVVESLGLGQFSYGLAQMQVKTAQMLIEAGMSGDIDPLSIDSTEAGDVIKYLRTPEGSIELAAANLQFMQSSIVGSGYDLSDEQMRFALICGYNCWGTEDKGVEYIMKKYAGGANPDASFIEGIKGAPALVHYYVNVGYIYQSF